MLQFLYRFAFLPTFRISNQTPKITRILMLYQANAPNLMRCNFLKHTPKLIYNLQSFKHNTLINELLLMQFYFFNIRPKLHHWKWWKLRVTLFRTFSTTSSLLMLLFVQPLSGNFVVTAEHCNLYILTDFWSKFCLLYWTPPCWLPMTGSVMRNFQNLHYFQCPVWKTKSW